MTLRSQPPEGCASASFATSAHQIRCRTIAGASQAGNAKQTDQPRPARPERAMVRQNPSNGTTQSRFSQTKYLIRCWA